MSKNKGTREERAAQRYRRIMGKPMTTQRFRAFMTKILGHHESSDPLMQGLVSEARRIRSELLLRKWNMQDYRAIAKFIGERAVSLCILELPLQEWVYIGGHLFTASEVDEMYPEGWREEAEQEKAEEEAGTRKHWAVSIQPSYYRTSII